MSDHLHEVVKLPPPFGPILEAMQAAKHLADARHRRVEQLVDTIHRHDDEMAELRDALLALSNRIESLTRVLHARTDDAA